MPVRYQYLPFGKVRHEMRRHKITSPVNARLSSFRIKLLKPASDRHIGTDNEHGVRKAAVAPVIDLVQDAPCGYHTHDRCLAGPSGHLAGITTECLEPFGFSLFARLLRGKRNSLQKVSGGLFQKDSGFRCLKLREK